MNKSEKIGELALALSKAQGAMRAAQKDRENPFFKSAYATLASVIEAIREPFSLNNLAFSQPTRVDDQGHVFVETIIMHGASGEWISGEASAIPVKQDPQGIGSLISYLKRYGLQAMVGIASEDDDGNAATSPQREQKSAPPVPAPRATSVHEAADMSFKEGVPKRPRTYNKDSRQDQDWIMKIFKSKNIPDDQWDAIGNAMHGQPPGDLPKVMERILGS